MSQKLGQLYSIAFAFMGISILNKKSVVLAQTQLEKTIRQSDRYSAENITQVRQLRNISPSDWSYAAIRNLAGKYDCVKDFPDGTFQGDRLTLKKNITTGKS